MEKTIGLALNKFPVIPSSLRASATVPVDQISVSLAGLYHHYYLDSRGRTPPDPDPAQFEHLEFLLPSDEFRVRGDGMGNSSSYRRHRSNELGHAFCRWFLHDHLNITYFAHMEDVINRELRRGFGGRRVERIAAGDTPDYFCAESVDRIFLAEAKGRHSSIGFGNKDFESWRRQFDRVVVKDKSGHERRTKGYIVATRFATESKPSTKSILYAEDPETPGRGPLTPDEAADLGTAAISLHYSGIALKMGQPILSSALSNGYVLPDEIRFPVVIWSFQTPPLQGTRFVGGYFPSLGGALPIRQIGDRIEFRLLDPFRLDVGRGTFFGLEESMFRKVVDVVRAGPSAAALIGRFELVEPFYSGISLLRDGSIVGPIEFFSPIAEEAM